MEVKNVAVAASAAALGVFIGAYCFSEKPREAAKGPSKKKLLSAAAASKWKGRHILEVGSFNRQDLNELFSVADEMDELVKSEGTTSLCQDSVIALLFYEPSTRTRCSFESAMLRMGGKVVVIADAKSQSSVKKGETIQDTICSLQSYADVIAMRHPQIGSAKKAASVASVPILNGGDGAAEHPTQALLDCYTIFTHCGQVDGLTISLVGDLKYGRTVHSLAKILCCFEGITLNYVAPPELSMPDEFMEYVSQFGGVAQNEYHNLEDVLGETDVLYMTRIQRERFQNVEDYEKVKDSFVLDTEHIQIAKPGMKVMHPLPRVNEISTNVDEYEGAIYFDQMRCGMILRMALIASVLGKV